MALTDMTIRRWKGSDQAGGTVRRIAAGTAAGLGGLVGAGWLGLRVPPAPFPAYEARAAPLEAMPRPSGLPPPVERYY